MSFSFLCNFRATSGLVADGGSEYCGSQSNTNGGTLEAFDVNRDGFHYGYVSPGGGGTRDRNTDGDARFSGVHFNEGGTLETFKLTLPAAGQYQIRGAFGDPTGGFAQTVKVELFDDTSSLGVMCNGTTSAANRFFDASNSNTEMTAANWDANNVAITKTFTTTTLIVKLGNGASTSTGWMAHLEVTQVAVAATSGVVVVRSVPGGTGGAMTLIRTNP